MDKKYVGTYIVTAIYFLFSGIEYAIILPTLNLFLDSFNAPKIYLGLALSSFSLTGLISAPIYGRFTDKYDSTKAVVILSNIFEIGGNILYFMAWSPWVIVASRMIAGVGSGSSASIFGTIARTTTEEQRTAAFSLLLSLRQFGLLVGPACQLFLIHFDFYIGRFHLTSINSPGLFMAALWTIHQLLMVLFYRDVKSSDTTTQVAGGDYERLDNEDDSDNTPTAPTVVQVSTWKEMAIELLNENVVACLFMAFAVMFFQTSSETVLTPLTQLLFDWKEFANSMVFLGVGSVALISFLSLSKISKKVSDRKMLFVGLIILNLNTIAFIVFYNYLDQLTHKFKMIFFVIYSIVLVFDLPFIWVPQVSLFTKITKKENQAFYQGVRILLMRFGMILGPLWTSSTLSNYNYLLGLNLAISAIVFTMVCVSYKKLVPPSTTNNDNEEAPLLAGYARKDSNTVDA